VSAVLSLAEARRLCTAQDVVADLEIELVARVRRRWEVGRSALPMVGKREGISF
jgi:hypothetical protein